MEHDLVLEGRVVTPEEVIVAEVGVSDGVVSEIGHGLRGARRIRPEGCLVFPGFVDMHVHLREPGWERKEDFRTGTLAAAHGGVTTVVDMPNNPAPTSSKAALEMKRNLAKEKGVVDVRLYGAVLEGNLRMLGELSSGTVGYKLYLSETTGTGAFPRSRLGSAFAELSRIGKPLSLHCEDQGVIARMREELMDVQAPDLHCDARPPEAETSAVRSAVAALADNRELRANICHASTGETIDIVRRAREAGLKVRCEATLHHLYFNRRAMLENGRLKTNPPLRSEDDRQAVLRSLSDGGVSFLVTDHAPHLESEKDLEGAAGVPGLDDYGHVVSWLVKDQGVDPLTIARVASRNPSKHLGLADRGEIAVGKRADFTIMDMHSPERVISADLRTKCGWSPYEGREFKGRARWTIVAGEPVMDDFEISC